MGPTGEVLSRGRAGVPAGGAPSWGEARGPLPAPLPSRPQVYVPPSPGAGPLWMSAGPSLCLRCHRRFPTQLNCDEKRNQSPGNSRRDSFVLILGEALMGTAGQGQPPAPPPAMCCRCWAPGRMEARPGCPKAPGHSPHRVPQAGQLHPRGLGQWGRPGRSLIQLLEGRACFLCAGARVLA